MSASKRGIFVVVEGLDKAGKSSQCAKLAQNAESLGHKVLALRFPDRTTAIGKTIDAYLKGDQEVEDHAIHLLFSTNRWEAAARITAAVAAGHAVIADRYFYSGVAYSAAMRNPTLPASWARTPEVGLLLPDMCFFLDVSEEVAALRGGGCGEEKYERARCSGGLGGVWEAAGGGAERGESGCGEGEMLEAFRRAVTRLPGYNDL
jgi:dTMP kinase